MDLVFTVGAYDLLAMALRSFGVELDDDLQTETIFSFQRSMISCAVTDRTGGTDMAHFAKPAEGSWTEHYPELGTGPVSYEDSISPEHYELERKAIFARTWLNVGRVEQLPRSRQLLHQGARRRRHVGGRRAGHGRRGPRLPQHLPPPRQQAGVERLPARGDERHLPAVHLQVPRLALRPRRRS